MVIIDEMLSSSAQGVTADDSDRPRPACCSFFVRINSRAMAKEEWLERGMKTESNGMGDGESWLTMQRKEGR